MRRIGLVAVAVTGLACAGVLDALPRDATPAEEDALILPDALPLAFEADRVATVRANGTPATRIWATFIAHSGQRVGSEITVYETITLAADAAGSTGTGLFAMAAGVQLDAVPWAPVGLANARVWVDAAEPAFYLVGRRDRCVLTLGVVGLDPGDAETLSGWIAPSLPAIDRFCADAPPPR